MMRVMLWFDQCRDARCVVSRVSSASKTMRPKRLASEAAREAFPIIHYARNSSRTYRNAASMRHRLERRAQLKATQA
jgi:hypothetical protein